MPFLYVKMRDILRRIGNMAEQRQELCVPQAIINELFCTDTSLSSEASPLVFEFKLISRRALNVNTAQKTDAEGGALTELWAFWRRAYDINRRFPSDKKYSGILAESPNLTQVCNCYMM